MIVGILLIAIVIISTSLKGTQHELGGQLQEDMLGKDGFIAWGAALVALGSLGYVPALRTMSRYLLALIAVVMVLRNGGVFSQLQSALMSASAAGPAPSIGSPPLPSSSSGSSSSGGGSKGGGGGDDTGAIVGEIAQFAALALL